MFPPELPANNESPIKYSGNMPPEEMSMPLDVDGSSFMPAIVEIQNRFWLFDWEISELMVMSCFTGLYSIVLLYTSASLCITLGAVV